MRFPPVSRIVPGALGLAMAFVAIAAALGSGTGATASAGVASSACVYGVCPASSGISPMTLDLLLAGLLVVAIVLGLLIYRDRRNRGPPPAQPWVDSSASSGGPAGPGDAPEMAGAAVGAGAVAAGAAFPYAESPDDVSAPPPEVPAPATAPVAEGQEGDIDSLMAELDRISGEILKRGQTPKKGAPTPPDSEETKE
ncbi:MAG: hypothetical protein L3K08_04165 [Thermoplasmata archaeon]|nr:hypothetical protein [Thermoplasmata archaeon]